MSIALENELVIKTNKAYIRFISPIFKYTYCIFTVLEILNFISFSKFAELENHIKNNFHHYLFASEVLVSIKSGEYFKENLF
jgi:hypothetical protein